MKDSPNYWKSMLEINAIAEKNNYICNYIKLNVH